MTKPGVLWHTRGMNLLTAWDKVSPSEQVALLASSQEIIPGGLAYILAPGGDIENAKQVLSDLLNTEEDTVESILLDSFMVSIHTYGHRDRHTCIWFTMKSGSIVEKTLETKTIESKLRSALENYPELFVFPNT